MNSRFLPPKARRLTNPFLLLSLFLLITFLAKAQDCPPTLTSSAEDTETSVENPIGSGNWTVCPGNRVLIVSTSASGYQWYHNGVLIDTATHIAISAKDAGNYHVVVDGCGTASNTITINWFDLPSAIITLSDSPVCSGDNVTVTLSGDLTYGWSWWEPEGLTGNPVTVSYTQNQTFTAVINSVDNCPTFKYATLIVRQPLDPGEISASDNICSGDTPSLLTGTTPTGEDGTYLYQWQQSTAGGGGPWTNATPGPSTNTTYQPPALTQTTWYRRVVTTPDPYCPLVTQFDPIEITVNEIPTITSATALEICSTDNVDYTITSDVDGTTFEWTGVNTSGNVTGVSLSGSGNIIDDQLSIPVGDISGTATYTITPTGPAPTYCEGDPVDLVVTVLPLPIPTISGDATVCIGSTDNLYSTEAGMGNTYVWTTSAGGTITSGQGTREIAVEWTAAGSQWVRVTYTGLNGCNPIEPAQFDVTVNELPVPGIAGPPTPCLGATGNVYTTESGMSNYDWEISSGGTITGGGDAFDNITITWNTPGVQWVSVVYTDLNGCTNTTPTVYNVNVSEPSIDGPTTPCLGSSTNVYTTESGMTDYVWNYPGGTLITGGTPSSNTATIQWNSTGTKTVTVNYTTAAGCTAASPATISVEVQPLPTPTISGDNDVCEGATGVVYTTQSGMTPYSWSVSAGGTITSGGTEFSNTATVTWNTAGNQEVFVNYTDANGCSAESPTSYPVTVNTLPLPTITGSNSICNGTTGVVYTTEAGQSNYDWAVTGGTITSGGTSSDNTATITWNTSGPQTVSVNYTNSNGCDAATPSELTVDVLPLPVPNINGFSSVCVNATNVEYTTDDDTGITDYQWTVSSGGTIVGSSTNNNVFINWNTVGPQTVQVTYTGANGCDAATPSTYNVTVNDLPSPTITDGPNEVCNNSTGNIYTTQPGMTNYEWLVTGGTITSGGTSTDNTATITWNTTGIQNVSINYSQTGCPGTSPYVYDVTVNPLPTSDAGPPQSIPHGTFTFLEGVPGAGTPGYTQAWTPIASINGSNTTLQVQTENLYTDTDFTFTVTDSKGCIATDIVQVTLIGPELEVTATASPQAMCNIGTTVQLNASASGGNSATQADYTWTSTPAGFTSSLQNPEVNPTQTTTYNVSVYDGYNTATNTVLVTVNPLPTIYNVTGGGEYCDGGTGVSVGLSGSQSGVNYQLLLDGSNQGTPLAGTGSAISFDNLTSEGEYTIQATNATTSCEQDMNGSVTISINPLPIANAGFNETIPYGTSTILSGSASAGTTPFTYQWTPSNMISTGATTLTPTTENLTATQTYTLTVTDSKLCVDDDVMDVIVSGNALSVDAVATPDEICNNGATVQLGATADGGNSANQADYSWTSTPSGFTSNDQNPTDTPLVTTTYHVSVYDGFNSATNSVTVTVNPLPTVFTVTGGGEYCSGGTGVSVGLNGSQSGAVYQLLRDGINLGTPIPGTGGAISFDNLTLEGDYTIHATNSTTSCEQDMAGSVTISINPLPTAFAGNDQNILHGMSTNLTGVANQGTIPYSYLWTPENMISSGSTTLTPTTNNLFATQTFVFTVTDSKQCTATDDMDVIISGDPLSVTASADITTVCEGSDVQLSASGAGGSTVYTYAWSSDQGPWESYEQNPLVNPLATTVYTVTIDDGYNTANSNITIIVNPNPSEYTVSGGGEYCDGETGVDINLDDSEVGVNYQLYIDDVYTGDEIAGTGDPITFPEQANEGEYSIIATRVSTSCESLMTGTTTITILPLPNDYDLSGGGSYPEGGVGVQVGLDGSQIGVDYQLWLDGVYTGITETGTGNAIEFGYQTAAGEYTVRGINTITGCYLDMTSTVTVIIDPYPGIFNVFGGGTICANSDIEVGLDGSEIGIEYTLIRDGMSISNTLGTGDSLNFGNFSIAGTYTVMAVNTTTGLDTIMAGNAVIIVEPLPILYNLTYLQPSDGCVPIIPHLNGSQSTAIYELNYEDNNGYYSAAIETLNGTGSQINFSAQTNAGIYTVTATIDYVDISCTREMSGSIVADSVPKEFEITPQGELCENDEELCILGSEEGVDYQLWLNSQPFGSVISGLADGGSICFGTLTDPGTYRIHAQNTITNCEIFFTEEIIANPQPIKYVMAPVYDCAGAEIILNDCEDGIDYYLYFEPATNMREFIEIQGPISCSGGGSINFGPQFDEGIYRIKAVNPLTNCSVWMDGTTTIYPNPEVFEISPQAGGCAPLEIYLENFEADATYYLYLDGDYDNPIQIIEGSTGQVNFGEQYTAGTYTVRAKLTHPGPHYCWEDMSGEVNVYDAAQVFTLTPEGPSCPPVIFQLSGSEVGTDYTLWRDNFGEVQTVTGDGNNFSFNEQTEAGQYWVIASTGNACETQMNGIGVINEIPTLYSITPIGQLCSDDNVEIGLTDSDIGVIYKLMRDNSGTNPQAEVIGDGNAIIFGNFTAVGTYTVLAVDDVTACERQMDGELILNDPPNIYSIVPDSGLYCPPQTISLELSQTGVDYTLHTPDGNDVTISGTGSQIEFGTFTNTGDYYVTAFNSTTGCNSDMDGVVTIYNGPDVFDLTCLTEPLYCFGDDSAIELVLSYSQTGTSYQLYRDDDSNPVFPAQTGTGSLLTWTEVSQYGPGDYYVKATFIADPTCSATMNGIIAVEEIPLPTASLSGTETICYGYCTNMEFTLTGTLPFEVFYKANDIIQDPVYFTPGNEPFLLEVCPVVTTTYEIVSIQYTEFPLCEGTDISGTFDVVVEPLPVIVDMGSPATTCITEDYTTDVIAENASAYSWVILGTPNGTISSDNTLNTTYTPAAGDEGTTVQLELTAWGEGSCAGETTTSILDIIIEPIPVITQLDGGTICETGDFTTGVLVEFASSYLWEIVTGNGTVSPVDEMNTTYTAAPGDGGTTVVLQITATGSGTCSNEEVTSQVEIIVEPLPTADAGTGGTICESEPFQLNGSATNETTVLWEVIDGIGTFDDETALDALFTPGDVSNNTAMTLRLTVYGTGTCNGEVATSEVIIDVEPLPEADAGLGGIICETQGYHFANATVRNNSSFVWEIQDGSGHFDDPLNLSPVFYPDPVNQITEMTLRLVAFGLNNCSTATDTSFVIITVHPQPVAYAGEGGETCVNTPFALVDATAEHQSSVLWEVVTGEGDIDSPLNVNPNYIPDVADAGTIVTLKLTVYGDGPCSDISTNDFVNIFIQGLPTVDAGPSLETCFSDAITITQASAEDYEEILWTHDGNGTLNNSTNINPTYIPAAGDEGNTITLTLSAQGMDACTGELVTDQTTILVAPLPEAFAGLDATICELENYTILDASASFESSVVWSVINGSGTITEPFEVNTTYIPSASDAGTTVRLRLTVYGIGNCAAYSTFDEINIFVNESPIALFNVDSPVCENVLVSFTDQSSTTAGIIEQWVWDFGDGSAPTIIDFPDNPNTTHSYTLPGVYPVSLMVTTSNSCTDTYSTEIEISPAPVAAYDYTGGLCAESEVDFIDLSQENGGGNIIFWNWDFGDGSTSTEQNPTHIFNTAGDYDVSLIVTNTENCISHTFIQTITIGDPITVTIDDADLIACLNEPHQFNGISPEAEYWNWDFGDGTTSTLQNPNHTYTSVGNYTVTLTGSDINGCQNVDVTTVTVSPNPQAFFSSEQSACTNEQISFSDASTSPNGQITEWLWDMGDGTVIGPITIPADRNVTHSYTFAGSYEVILTVTDVSGCSDSFSRILIIENGPLANFTFDAACLDQAVIFTDLSSPNGGSDLLTWQWDFGDPLSGTNNTSNLQNPSHNFVGDMPAGGFTVTLTVTNTQGCINTYQTQLELAPPQTITISADQNPVCLGESILFSSDATNVESWLWNFGDGNTSTQANPSHTYQIAGNYNVTLDIQDANGCNASATHQVEVNELPTALYTNTTPGCGLQTITFTDLSVSPNGAIVDWLWDFGDGNTSTLQNPDNEYLTAGTFIVSLVVIDETGCTDTYQKTISIDTAPIANFAFEAACLGQPVIFTDLSSVNNGSNIIGWQWNFGDPASGTANSSTVQNPTHIFVGNMPAGGFTVSLTVTNVDGCTDTFETQVILNEGQTITISTDNDIHCLGEIVQFSSDASNVQSWLWNFGDGNTSIQANPSHIYQFVGNYNVTLNIQDVNGCLASANHLIEVNELPTANFSNTAPGCPDETIYFTDLSISPNGGIANWLWDFGDGNTVSIDAPNDPDVEHIYANTGTYNVTLTVTDNTGCEDSFTRQIVTENSPLANFNFTQTCFGEPVLFTDLSSPNGGSDLFSWLWDFGDQLSGINNTSTLQNPSHLFTDPGVYTVSLTVTNTQGCSSTFEADVTVSETVDIDFETAATAFCPGETIDFTPLGADIVSYEWNFGDGGTSIQQTPQYIYSLPGTYTVSLLVTAVDGCQGYVEHDVIINEEPVAAFSTDSPSCSGAPTQFFNASSSPTGYITEWIWNFGDGSPEVIVAFPDNPDVEYSYPNEGTYNATLTVTNSNGCSNSISHEVIVAPGPIAAFDHSGSCAESPVSFTDLSQENGGGIITGWQWNFDDLASGTANTSTLQNPEHSFTAPGDYDVELIITNINGCTDTVVNTITIDEALLVEITADNETLCLGTPVNFTGTAAGAVIWNWDFGDGNTATQQNPSHTYTATGIFTVSLTAETPEGCYNTATLEIEVNPTPIARFINSGPTCSSDSVYFTNQSTTPNGFIQTYIWDLDDGTVITVDAPDDPNIAHLYANPGTYEVSLTVIDDVGCENTSSNLVQVEASPIADFSSGESCFGTPVFFTDLTSPNGGPDLFSWQWWFGDPNSGINNTSTLQNPTHLFSVADTFDVTLVVTNTIGCSDTIVNQVIVSALPDVDFTIANDSICLNTAAEFTGIGENINTWFWEFGDGGSSIQQSPSYMYAEPGHYDVTLTVTNINQCQNSITQSIFINDAPIADFSLTDGCLGDSTYFMDETVSLNGFIEIWEWDFGDGNTATVQNPAHLYADADDYLVTLTATDNFGCFETISRWVSIYEKPIAAFSYNQVCDPSGQVFFFNESESSSNGSPILEFEWNFHDGYFSNEINPNHIFPETDTCYIVSLTITDAFGCDSTVTDTICIWEPLTVDFTATEECLGLPTFFEASYLPEDDSIVSFAWNFNDGSDIFLTYRDTTSHIFPLAGTYFVELTTTNLNGCENTIYREVTVNGLPLPDFSYEPGLCDDPVAFTDLSDGNGALVENWFWDFGDPDSGPDNFSTLQSPTHLYSDQGGVYQVKLIVTNFNGCTDSITKEVVQDPCVQASFIAPSITLCADSTICFTDNSYIAADNGSINRWIWNFGDNTPDYEYTELENPVCHTFAGREGGEFVVSLTIEATVNGSPFTDTHTDTITIYPKPTARFIPTPVCQNTDAVFTDNSTGNGLPITSWFWDFGDLTTINDTSSQQNPAYRYPDYGLFDVQLVVTNEFDCSDTLISEMEIYQPPTADFIAVDSCVTYITYFNDLTETGGAPIDSYFWHFGDPGSNSGDGNPWTDSTSTDRWAEHIYNSAGTYFTTLVVEDENSCRDTVRHSLPVHPIPNASFIYEDRYEGRQGQVFFESTSDATAISFFWDFMTGETSDEENPVYQFEEDGLYDVMLIAYNDHLCPDTAINQYEIIFTGLYFPNTFVPNSDDEEVNTFKGLGENLETYNLEIYTSWGQLIWSSSALQDGKPLQAWDGTYNNQDLPTGSYIWKASATFKDGTIWEGSDNGDGNLKTYGILNLIR